MARSGMAELITELRSLAYAGTADYTIAGSAYWTDDQLQTLLDRTRVDVRYGMDAQARYIGGGSVVYTDYTFPDWRLERAPSGTLYFRIENSTGDQVGTVSYSVDYDGRRVVFGTPTGGSAYWVVGRSFDVKAAAAQVWREKASYYSASFDVSTDNHSLKRSQLIAHCLQMAAALEAETGAGYAVMVRTDANW